MLAYKEPKGEDEGIADTDLKLRFYEHLSKFAGSQQVLIVDNTTPPPDFIPKAVEFTGNPDIPRYGLFPHIPEKKRWQQNKALMIERTLERRGSIPTVWQMLTIVFLCRSLKTFKPEGVL